MTGIPLNFLICGVGILIVAANGTSGGAKNPSWFISSPNYPGRFPESSNVTHLLELPDVDTTVLLQFTVLDLRTPFDNDYATLEIYDGNTTSAPSLGTFKGLTSNPPTIQSTSNFMLLTFKTYASNGYGTGDGYYATYDAVTQDISLTNHSGTFTTPNYPDNYSNSELIQWTIQVPDYELVRLEFNDFETESCCDWVEIRNGPALNSSLMASLSGPLDISPGTFIGTTNSMHVRFTCDGSGSARGFSATYYPGTKEYLGHPFGEFHTTNYPENYASWTTHQWVIELPNPSDRVLLEFKTFQTELTNDVLTIRDGDNDNSTIIGVHSGDEQPPVYLSKSNVLFLSFVADWSNEFPGFSARYETVGIDYTTTTTEAPVPICTEPGVYSLPFPGDCTMFYLCVNLVAYPDSCADGLYFDPTIGECNLAGNVVCEWAPTTTEGSICPSEGVVYLPVPEDCSAYILCADGDPTSHTCPQGTLFDPVELKCKVASDVECQVFCPAEGILYLPKPGSCTDYILCADGVPAYRTCAPGTLFDPTELKCKTAEEVTCEQ